MRGVHYTDMLTYFDVIHAHAIFSDFSRSSGFPTRSDTNRAEQLQKMARGLKFRIYEAEGLYYLCSEIKALISFAVTAKLICVFVFAYAKSRFFSRRGSYIVDSILIHIHNIRLYNLAHGI